NQAGFIDHFHKDSKHNLVPLCKEHHKEIHDGKIQVEGFVMTSNGLALKYEQQMKKPKEKIVEEPEINESKEDESKGFVLDDWD
ncbi:MAG: hypothetical protein OQK11_06300, partial [Thiovulaceae bacterium]|nr:hypothetical protein [Sulfurimonadaceae bacterium]